MFGEGDSGTARIVAPVALSTGRDPVQREVYLSVEDQAGDPNIGRSRGRIGEVDRLVDGHCGDGSELVVDVGAEGADPVGRPDDPDCVRIDAVPGLHFGPEPLDIVLVVHSAREYTPSGEVGQGN